VPYRPVATVRAGAQVLIDVGPSMSPFRQDVVHLLGQLDGLLGPGRTHVLEFARRPSLGVRAWQAVTRRARWRPPIAGASVLVVSDFGIVSALDDVDDLDPEEWRVFAEQTAAAGCSAVALVPFAPGRWPPDLTRMMRCVHWSERTTARQIVRALRERRSRPAARR
jgi:hypothetical protein